MITIALYFQIVQGWYNLDQSAKCPLANQVYASFVVYKTKSAHQQSIETKLGTIIPSLSAQWSHLRVMVDAFWCVLQTEGWMTALLFFSTVPVAVIHHLVTSVTIIGIPTPSIFDSFCYNIQSVSTSSLADLSKQYVIWIPKPRCYFDANLLPFCHNVSDWLPLQCSTPDLLLSSVL